MKRNFNVVKFDGRPVTLKGKMIKQGSHSKNFVAVGTDLKPVKLSDFQNKVRVISSVPSVDTGVCAKQTRRFNLEASKLPDIQILTISCDLPFALQRFCAAEGIENLITISDHKDVDFGIKYGFLIEEYRLLTRGIVIIDKNNTVRYVEYVPEISEEPDYDKALEVVKSIV